MRKSKIVLLLAGLLATVMGLSSCGFVGGIDFADIVDGSAYVDEDPAYAAIAEVADLAKASMERQQRQLILFKELVATEDETFEKFMVYNLATGKVVYTATENGKNNIVVSLGNMGYYVDYAAYFTVTVESWTEDANGYRNSGSTYTTALYDAAGTQVASANRSIGTDKAYDLLRFDGKCYRVGENGTFAAAFDYMGSKELPEIRFASEDYYYGKSENVFYAYDKELNVVAYYDLPSYAEISMDGVVQLENGKILFQYTIEEPEDAEEYDFIAPKYVDIYGYLEDMDVDMGYEATAKYSLYTVILDAKKNDVKEVEMDYMLMYGVSANDSYWTEMCGFNDEIFNLALAFRIEEGRVNMSASAITWVTISNSGKVKKELENLTVVPMEDLPSMVAANRWEIETVDDREYVIDENGEILGEVTNASSNKEYYVIDGKLYNKSLEVAYNFAENGWTLDRVTDDSVIFTNAKYETMVYANGTATTLDAKDSSRNVIAITDDYILVQDNKTEKVKLEICNLQGKVLKTLELSDWQAAQSNYANLVQLIATVDGAALITVRDYNTEKLEYVYTYYRLG